MQSNQWTENSVGNCRKKRHRRARCEKCGNSAIKKENHRADSRQPDVSRRPAGLKKSNKRISKHSVSQTADRLQSGGTEASPRAGRPQRDFHAHRENGHKNTHYIYFTGRTAICQGQIPSFFFRLRRSRNSRPENDTSLSRSGHLCFQLFSSFSPYRTDTVHTIRRFLLL